jgi:hypothetical protein
MKRKALSEHLDACLLEKEVKPTLWLRETCGFRFSARLRDLRIWLVYFFVNNFTLADLFSTDSILE